LIFSAERAAVAAATIDILKPLSKVNWLHALSPGLCRRVTAHTITR
jgi:hypothetical protein